MNIKFNTIAVDYVENQSWATAEQRSYHRDLIDLFIGKSENSNNLMWSHDWSGHSLNSDIFWSF